MAATEMISEGSPAPRFSLPDQSGEAVSLESLAGKWVVLYFYPKDDTPGCTQEACNFRDNYGALKAAGAVVLGVSGDTSASHSKFATKYELPFPLLVDERQRGRPRVRRVGQEEELRQDIRGDHPLDVHHRPGWQGREALGAGEARRARRGGAEVAHGERDVMSERYPHR